MQTEHLYPREGKQANLGLVGHTALVKVLTNTATGITAHHGLATVGIKNAHGKISLGHGRLADEHQSVGTDALVAVTPLDGGRLRVGDIVLRGVNVDVVVTTAVHLGEMYLAHANFCIFTFFHLGMRSPSGLSGGRWP